MADRMSTGTRSVAPKAVIIEDAEDLSELWSHELEDAGFMPFQAADGVTGVEAIRRVEPVVIVLDLLLPRLDGFSVARCVRSLPGGDDIAIVGVTAVASSALRREAIEAGCDVCLAKPVAGAAVAQEAARLFAEKTGRRRAL